MNDKKISIERTTASGYKSEEFSIQQAVIELNSELENKRTIWIDGKPFMEDMIAEKDISHVKKGISITNKLVGG